MTSNVWMFHRVLPDEPQAFGLPSCYRLRGTAVTPAEWESFLDSLDATAPLSCASVGAEETVLTFDDGYREWIDLVGPSLRRRGFTATFFACRAFCAEARVAHGVDQLYWLLDHAQRPELRAVVDGEAIAVRVDTREGKRAAIAGVVKERVVTGEPTEVAELLGQVAQSLNCEVPADLPARLYPTEAEWRGLAHEFAVGAHGLTHRRSSLLSDEELREELDGARHWVLGFGGVDWWCHPDGDSDRRVQRLVRDAGYEDALGVESGRGPFDRPRRFATPAAITAPRQAAGARRVHVAQR